VLVSVAVLFGEVTAWRGKIKLTLAFTGCGDQPLDTASSCWSFHGQDCRVLHGVVAEKSAQREKCVILQPRETAYSSL
jgi:hypothetical protein